MKKLGIMGGTFNPPHSGHLEAARHAKNALELDRVLFIPTNIPPHKQLPRGSASTAQRCEMVRLLLQNEPWGTLSTLEIDRGGASYTVDTVQALRAGGAWDKIFLILGTDMLMTLDEWRNPAEICRLAAFAVVARTEQDRVPLARQAQRLREQYGAEIRLIDCPALPISSTQLREVDASENFLPPALRQYIARNHLYH